MPGAAVQVSAGYDGSACCVNRNDEVFRWNGMAWDKLPGALTYVSCANSSLIWGTNRSQELWYWQGNNWVPSDGKAVQGVYMMKGFSYLSCTVSVGEDGTVWCVNASQEVYYRSGPHSPWVKAPGQLTCVSCHNASTVVGNNASGEIWIWNGHDWSRGNGIPLAKLLLTSSGATTHISTGSISNGHVWGVNAAGEVWKHHSQ
jgi:hypothetical protein